MNFDEDYFENGIVTGLSLYESYRWLPEMTIPLAAELVNMLDIRRGDRILDFGCAKGFLVKAFRLLHYEAWGEDVSAYAINSAPADVKEYLTLLPASEYRHPSTFAWTIAKDVFEHLSKEELKSTLLRIRHRTHRAFVVVPLGNGHWYNWTGYEKDVTHVIRESLPWWAKQFEAAGFTVREATTSMPFIKKARCPQSDGFFVLS